MNARDFLLETKRHVRTPAGVRYFHLPIGSPIGEGIDASHEFAAPKWKASMTRDRAEVWAKDSAVQGIGIHVSRREDAAKIKREGFKTSGTTGYTQNYGEGVYFSMEEVDPDTMHDRAANMYARHKRVGDTHGQALLVKANVRNPLVLTTNRTGYDTLQYLRDSVPGYKEAQAKLAAQVKKTRDQRRHLYGTDEYVNGVKNSTVRRIMQHSGLIDPSDVLQSMGFDSIVIHNPKFNKRVGGSQVVVFDPKNVTVVADQKPRYVSDQLKSFLADLEVKVIRHVRTPEGVARFHKPIGAIITRTDYIRAKKREKAAKRIKERLEEPKAGTRVGPSGPSRPPKTPSGPKTPKKGRSTGSGAHRPSHAGLQNMILGSGGRGDPREANHNGPATPKFHSKKPYITGYESMPSDNYDKGLVLRQDTDTSLIKPEADVLGQLREAGVGAYYYDKDLKRATALDPDAKTGNWYQSGGTIKGRKKIGTDEDLMAHIRAQYPAIRDRRIWVAPHNREKLDIPDRYGLPNEAKKPTTKAPAKKPEAGAITASRQRWAKGKVSTSRRDQDGKTQTVLVDGEVSGNFGIHKNDGGTFTVVHTPTGYAAAPGGWMLTKVDAYRYAHAFDSIMEGVLPGSTDADNIEAMKKALNERNSKLTDNSQLGSAAARTAIALVDAGAKADGRANPRSSKTRTPSTPQEIDDAKKLFKSITGRDWTPSMYSEGNHEGHGGGEPFDADPFPKKEPAPKKPASRFPNVPKPVAEWKGGAKSDPSWSGATHEGANLSVHEINAPGTRAGWYWNAQIQDDSVAGGIRKIGGRGDSRDDARVKAENAVAGLKADVAAKTPVWVTLPGRHEYKVGDAKATVEPRTRTRGQNTYEWKVEVPDPTVKGGKRTRTGSTLYERDAHEAAEKALAGAIGDAAIAKTLLPNDPDDRKKFFADDTSPNLVVPMRDMLKGLTTSMSSVAFKDENGDIRIAFPTVNGTWQTYPAGLTGANLNVKPETIGNTDAFMDRLKKISPHPADSRVYIDADTRKRHRIPARSGVAEAKKIPRGKESAPKAPPVTKKPEPVKPGLEPLDITRVQDTKMTLAEARAIKPSRDVLKDIQNAQEYMAGDWQDWDMDAWDQDVPRVYGDDLVDAFNDNLNEFDDKIEQAEQAYEDARKYPDSYGKDTVEAYRVRLHDLNERKKLVEADVERIEKLLDMGPAKVAKIPKSKWDTTLGSTLSILLDDPSHVFKPGTGKVKYDNDGNPIPSQRLNDHLDYLTQIGSGIQDDIDGYEQNDPQMALLRDAMRVAMQLTVTHPAPEFTGNDMDRAAYQAHRRELATWHKELYDKYRPIMSPQDQARVDADAKSMVAMDSAYSVKQAGNTVIQAARRSVRSKMNRRSKEIRLAYLSKIRPMGIDTDATEAARPDFNGLSAPRSTGANGAMKQQASDFDKLTEDDWDKLIDEGMSVYPTTWINEIGANTTFNRSFGIRAYMNDPGGFNKGISTPGEISLPSPNADFHGPYSGGFSSDSAQTAAHEFGHAIETRVPGIAAMMWTLRDKRTRRKQDGRLEKPRELYGSGSQEWAYSDEFTNPYSGRSYLLQPSSGKPYDNYVYNGLLSPHKTSTELFTTGVEDTFGDPTNKAFTRPGDNEVQQLILAMMATLHVAVNPKTGKPDEFGVWK